MARRKTRVISVGGVQIGGDNPISVQSMLKTDPQNLPETLDPAPGRKKGGLRADKDRPAPGRDVQDHPLSEEEVDIPIIGDVHFNHRIALAAIDAGIDCIRINPGTINNMKKMKEVAARRRDARCR